MTQIATVEKILPGGFVEISVPRKSACGHDCEECAGCGMTGAAIHARAKDPVGVRPGQKVVVESATRKILGVVALVYLLPVVGFLLGYISKKARNVDAVLGVICGIIVVVWMSLSPIFFKDGFMSEYASPFHANLTIVFGTIVIFLAGFLSMRLLKTKK